jgi:leucyl/phenylalanyl-tRNA--protein transferase
VAIGGDLDPDRLLAAYRQGIFPWYDEGVPPLWWSPNPRAVVEPGNVHVSRSLKRKLRAGGFELTVDRDFPEVVEACATRRQGGTWILPEVAKAYVELHRLGHAHSIEVWMDGELAGGLYGVRVGALFSAESMFHRRTDASKIALVAIALALFERGITLFDVQFLTDHLETLGATEVSRARYLARLPSACSAQVSLDALDPYSGLVLCLS